MIYFLLMPARHWILCVVYPLAERDMTPFVFVCSPVPVFISVCCDDSYFSAIICVSLS